jgi:hypothetical protein
MMWSRLEPGFSKIKCRMVLQCQHVGFKFVPQWEILVIKLQAVSLCVCVCVCVVQQNDEVGAVVVCRKECLETSLTYQPHRDG